MALNKLAFVSSQDEHQSQGQSHRELRLVSEIESNPDVTQRELSQRVGIALGLTNVLLRNLAQKGYVRVAHATWKRRLYSLTPEGLNHKIRLTVGYIQRFLDHYQRVRYTLRQQLEPLMLHEESRVAICGTGEFAELVYLGLKEYGIEEIDVFSDDGRGTKFLGMPVRNISELQPDHFDRIVIASLGDGDHVRSQLENQGAGEDKLVAYFAQTGDRGKG